MTWFGSSWEAPLNEHCQQQETPTGELCLYCHEPIEVWASGVVQLCLDGNPHLPGSWSRRPLHLECFTRMSVGSVGHLQRRCSCYGGDQDDPPELSIRQAARAAVLMLLVSAP